MRTQTFQPLKPAWSERRPLLYPPKDVPFSSMLAFIFPSLRSVLGRTVEAREHLGRGLWEPRVERGLQGPGGPGVSFWAVMGVGIELDVSDG